MSRIERTDIYPYKNPISLDDFLIGTDSQNSNRTKSFRIGDFVGFIEAVGLPNGQVKGEIVFDQGLRFLHTQLENVIDSSTYTVAAGAITGPNADSVNPRIDVIQADVAGNVSVLQGTAAASPIEPIIADPLSTVKISAYQVEANAASPSIITKTLMYDEDAGTGGGEYDVAAITNGGGNINLATPANPNTGAVSIAVSGTGPTGDLITMSPSAVQTIQSFTNIHLYLNNSAEWTIESRIKVVFYNGGAPVSSEVSIRNGNYGLVSNTLNQYQSIIIPKDDFEFRGNSYDQIQFQFENLPAGVMYLDTFNILGGIENPPRYGSLKALSDIPSTYVGKASHIAQINESETGWDFVPINALIPPYTADNGITLNGQEFELGGFLDKTIIIDVTQPTSQFILYSRPGGYFHIKPPSTHSQGFASAEFGYGDGFGFLIDGFKAFSDKFEFISSSGRGIEYDADYSGTFVDRSLVDKAYVDSSIVLPTGLEAINEGNGTGWALIGETRVDHVGIGLRAVDLTFSSSDLTPSGASGTNSLAHGQNSVASGDFSFASGSGSAASGLGSASLNSGIAVGVLSLATANSVSQGDYTFSSGFETTAFSYSEFSIGYLGTQYTPVSAVAPSPADRLFNIGNGINSGSRSDVFTVLKNGQVGVGISNFEANTTGERLQVFGDVKADNYHTNSFTFNIGNTISGNSISSDADWVNDTGSVTIGDADSVTLQDNKIIVYASDSDNPINTAYGLLANGSLLVGANLRVNIGTTSVRGFNTPNVTGGNANNIITDYAANSLFTGKKSFPDVNFPPDLFEGGYFGMRGTDPEESFFFSSERDNGSLYYSHFNGVAWIHEQVITTTENDPFLRANVADTKTLGNLRFNNGVAISLGTNNDALLLSDGLGVALDVQNPTSSFFILTGGGGLVSFTPGGNITTNGNVSVPDEAYDASWDENFQVPTKNAIYDQIRPYKTYVALISQVGTGTPTATVLENNLGETISFARNATGNYTLTATGAPFTSLKTTVSLQSSVNNNDGNPSVANIRPNTTSQISFWTADIDNAGVVYNDDCLNNSVLEIRVYP